MPALVEQHTSPVHIGEYEQQNVDPTGRIDVLDQISEPEVFILDESIEPGSIDAFHALGSWLDHKHAQHAAFIEKNPDLVRDLAPEYAIVGGYIMRVATAESKYGIKVDA